MHRNPVAEVWCFAGPVEMSSYRHYAVGEPGPVPVNEAQKAELHVRKIA